MAKKKKKEEPEKSYKDERLSIYESSKVSSHFAYLCNHETLGEDRLFAILVVSGYPTAQAYKIAYNSKASVSSCASLGCRKLKEAGVQFILRMISHSYWEGNIRLKDKYCKEGRKHWDPWMGRRVRKLKP